VIKLWNRKISADSQGVNTENVDCSRSLKRIRDFLAQHYAVSRSKYMTFLSNNISMAKEAAYKAIQQYASTNFHTVPYTRQ
jgi:DNA-binding phage protein